MSEWVFLDHPSFALAPCVVDDFVVQKAMGRGWEKVVFGLHSHFKFSDGFLSPSKVCQDVTNTVDKGINFGEVVDEVEADSKLIQ